MKTTVFFIRQRGLRCAAAVLLAGLSTGCETTGDPRQGGLFGWSETKAIERQSALRDQFFLASEENRAAQNRSDSLRTTESGLRGEVADKSSQLAALRAEIAALDAQIHGGSIPASAARTRSAGIGRELGEVDSAEARKLENELALLNERINLLSR